MIKTITKNNVIKRAIIIILTLLCCGCCFAACGEEERAGFKVVYELEGGRYKNSTEPVEVRYNFKEGAEKTIKALEDLPAGAQSTIENQGYRLDGWYRTKTVDGETVSYSDEWNFSTDIIGEEGVTLYAKWVPITVYKYVIRTSDGAEVGSYESNTAGLRFSFVQDDVLKIAYNKEGYTPTGEFFADEALTIPFDNEFKFDESLEDQEVNVYAKYIEGYYKIVKTADELTELITSDDGAYEGRTIYLLNDIDLDGAQIKLASLFKINENLFTDDERKNGVKPENVKKYEKYVGIEGADGGKKISNFIVNTNGDWFEEDSDGKEIGTVKASLLGDLNGITVKNVSFDNVTMRIVADNSDYMNKVEVAPLCGIASGCAFENVSVNVIECKIRQGANKPEIIKAQSGSAWQLAFKNESSTFKSCSATFAEIVKGNW